MSTSPLPARILAAALLALGLGSSARADAAPGHPCASEADAGKRLACYDQAFGAPDTAAQAAAAEVRARESFGLENAPIELPKPVAVKQAVEAVDAIGGTVTAVVRSGRGERLVTLDSGQRWLIIEPGIRGPLKIGDQVTIRDGALSSFRLVTPGGVGLRVRRVR